MSEGIHPTAVIAEGAQIADDVVIGPYSVVGPKVVIGKGTVVGSHVVIEGHTTIGEENKIFQFASVGAVPQDLKYHGEDTRLEIGNKNLIREYVTLQPGTVGGHGVTVIGDSNLFMACSHVGHDGIVGSNNVFANSCALAGHVTIGSHVIVGGLCGIHQFVRVGDYAMLGAGSMVPKDIPPYCNVQGDRAGLVGINQIGLERNNFTTDQIRLIKNVYREVFYGGHSMAQRLEYVKDKYGSDGIVKAFIKFIEESESGITYPRRKNEAA